LPSSCPLSNTANPPAVSEGVSPAAHALPRNALDALSVPLNRRASSDAPNGYVPASVRCPSPRPSIRNGTGLSSQEREWLPDRRNATIEPIRDLLRRIAIPGFDSNEYLRDAERNTNDALPNIGIAISGGGYRAMLNGAGALAAWDSRSDGSDTKGNLGGLLQSSTYISGLSGGGWLVGSLYLNNFTSVQESMRSGAIWQTEESILEGPQQYSLRQYYSDILGSVGDKDDAGYDRSITDYWGRMLSYQLIDAPDGGPSVTFSSIADDEEFKNGRAPLPFLLAVGRDPEETIVSINSTVFEFTPWELGSNDPTLHGHAPLKYVGSKFDRGTLPEDESCIAGFDNAGFVMGTSSSLFNAFVLYLQDPESQYVPEGVPDFVIEGVATVLNAVGDDNNDIADWSPNPFKGFNRDDNAGVNSDRLTLVDGGEDLQNVPYHPHLHHDRKVDVVFSIDSSADTPSGWPDGASAIATYERSLEDISEGTGFPVVPGKETFLNLGLNSRPVFFGCNATNTTDTSPLIVYIPNYPYIYTSNISTFQMSINESERDAVVMNGWAVATQLNGTRDEQWPVCVGCAMLERSLRRTNTTVPPACRECFDRYCWDGTIDESTPDEYAPGLFSEAIDVQSAASKALVGGSALALAMVVGLAAIF
jgi:lysophospholipase